MLREDQAREFADHWVKAWNSHDLDRIMSHYEDDVVLVSPVAAKMLGDPSGRVAGKTALRSYFERGLEMYPNLVIQTTGVYRQDFLERVAFALGPDRIMFGGGSPVFDASYEILRVRLANLDAGGREAILGGTASRVFGL